MNPQEVLAGAQEALAARRVYGEPIRANSVTILPAAAVRGGGGGGGRSVNGASEGRGVGFGLNARPAGVFAVHDDGRVTWHPAIDVNRVILGGQLVMATALLTLRPLLVRWLARRLPA